MYIALGGNVCCLRGESMLLEGVGHVGCLRGGHVDSHILQTN